MKAIGKHTIRDCKKLTVNEIHKLLKRNTQINKPRVVGFAVDFVFFSITRCFLAEFQAAYTAFQTACMPSFAAHFDQVSIHNSSFAACAFLSVYLEYEKHRSASIESTIPCSERVRPNVLSTEKKN